MPATRPNCSAALFGDGASSAARRQHLRQQRRVEPHCVEREHLGCVCLSGRAPPAGPGRIAAVGRGHAGETEIEVVVGQHGLPGGGRNFRFGPTQPGPVRHGKRGREDRAHSLGTFLGTTEVLDQFSGVGGTAGVVPEGGFAQRPPGAVEHNQAVLLPADGYGRDIGGPFRLGQCTRQRKLPGFRVRLAGGPVAVDRVGRRTGGYDPAVVGLDDQDFCRLGGTVHPGHERHAGPPMARCGS